MGNLYSLRFACHDFKLLSRGQLRKMAKLFDVDRISLKAIQTLEIEPTGLPDFVAEGCRRLHDLHIKVDVVT